MIQEAEFILTLLIFLTIVACALLQRDPDDVFAKGVVAMFVFQAVNFMVIGQLFMRLDVLFIWLACFILIHFVIVHRHDPDTYSAEAFLAMRYSHLWSHETWVIACFTVAFVWYFWACKS